MAEDSHADDASERGHEASPRGGLSAGVVADLIADHTRFEVTKTAVIDSSSPGVVLARAERAAEEFLKLIRR